MNCFTHNYNLVGSGTVLKW